MPKSKRRSPGDEPVPSAALGDNHAASDPPAGLAETPPPAAPVRKAKRAVKRPPRSPYTRPGLAADSDLSAALDRILEAHEREILRARVEPAATAAPTEAHEALERRLEQMCENERRLRRELERERLSAREARELARRYQDEVRDALDRLCVLRHELSPPPLAITAPSVASAGAEAGAATMDSEAPPPASQPEPEQGFVLARRRLQGLLASLVDLAGASRVAAGRGLVVGLVALFAVIGAMAVARLGGPDAPTEAPRAKATEPPAAAAMVVLAREPEVLAPPAATPTAETTAAPLSPTPGETFRAVPAATPSLPPPPARPSPTLTPPAPRTAPVPVRRARRDFSLEERKLWETLTRSAASERIRLQATLGRPGGSSRTPVRDVSAAVLVEGRDELTSLDLDRVVRGLGLSWNGAATLHGRLLPGSVPTTVLGPALSDGTKPTQSVSFVVVFPVARTSGAESDTVLTLDLPSQAPLKLLWPARLLEETLLAKH